MSPLRTRLRRRSHCGAWPYAVYGPVFEPAGELIVPRVRVKCRRCGLQLERLSSLDAYVRVTRRLGEFVSRLRQLAIILDVARFFSLNWKTDQRTRRRSIGGCAGAGLSMVWRSSLWTSSLCRYLPAPISSSASIRKQSHKADGLWFAQPCLLLINSCAAIPGVGK